jgi:hypothetical protein
MLFTVILISACRCPLVCFLAGGENYTGVKFKVTGLIKWEFEYTLFAFQDELVDRLLSIKDKIFL